jgi:predicted phage-related endonuclease
MATQTYQNHAHRPTGTLIGGVFVVTALVGFVMRWFGVGGRESFAVGLLALVGAVSSLLWVSRTYTTKLQDRIIRLEMRIRGASLLTTEQQRLLSQLAIKQVVALRFASDEELAALLERASRERLAPADIKRAIKVWTGDLDRT